MRSGTELSQFLRVFMPTSELDFRFFDRQILKLLPVILPDYTC